jgi:hypothetical protein
MDDVDGMDRVDFVDFIDLIDAGVDSDCVHEVHVVHRPAEIGFVFRGRLSVELSVIPAAQST